MFFHAEPKRSVFQNPNLWRSLAGVTLQEKSSLPNVRLPPSNATMLLVDSRKGSQTWAHVPGFKASATRLESATNIVDATMHARRATSQKGMLPGQA